MNYTLHQLQIFLKISQSQSVTKTAEDLFLTQPAVSIQLKNFQDQFSIPLTEIVGRKLFVTDFGMEIAEAAEKILNEVNALNYKTLAYKGELSGRLKISVASTGKYVMPYFLSKFLKENRNKKKVRQIIVATHNPNIVVGADSELVICANQHGDKNQNIGSKKFQYVSGSLEHTFNKIDGKLDVLEAQGMREHVCEVLEGGDIAFKLREKKYAIKI